MKLHIYQNRHVFADDEHIGKYDTTTRAVRLRAEYGNLADQVKAFFMRTKGLPVKMLTGDESLPAAVPLIEFPDEVRAMMDPRMGDLTPAVVDHARKHFTREEFERRYLGRAEYYSFDPEANAPDPDDAPPAETPKKSARKRKTTDPSDA